MTDRAIRGLWILFGVYAFALSCAAVVAVAVGYALAALAHAGGG